jgi:chloride channel 7
VPQVAKWVGDYFSEGIYDMAIGIRHIPYLSWEPPREMMT